jgi:trehalose 6-phosphate synthase/phosphatase
VWVGWPGTFIPPELCDSAGLLLAPHGKPVFLDEEEYHGFYEQFSNRLLWPLFHNISGRLSFDRTAWHDYQRVNERFAEAVLEVVQPGDTVWVHDYQLALVPHMLRERGLDCAMGFFLHIPFPSHETYRTLPVREEVLQGMLGADLIGFHTYEFAQHFRNSCLRVLGLDSEQETISLPSHVAHLGVHPIGVDPKEIHEFTELPAVKAELVELKQRFRGKKVVLGVDRLDYTKGIPEKLLAFEEFLSNNPSWRSRAVLIQVASPSRMGVQEYKDLKREVDELVGRINGQFGSFEHTPIVYINQTVPRARLTALYRIADVAFITPLRDGMNLVALEYIAARGETPGALVLSEFAGAASCLAGARLVNPHNASRMADELAEVVADPETSALTFRQMKDFVCSNTAAVWADRFLEQLRKVHESQRFGAQRLHFSHESDMCKAPPAALFLLDYAGTLHPHVPILSETAPDSRLRLLLTKLADHARVYVMSGQPPEVLDAWFDGIPIGLICEDGLAVKHCGADWPELAVIDRSLLEDVVEPVMRDFYNHTPGSRIEHKRASLAWRFRLADPKLGPLRAKELYSQLEDLSRGSPYTVIANKRAVEVRPAEFTKTSVAEQLLKHCSDAELVFGAGNDRLDEDMFEVLLRSGRPHVMTCYVGGKDTVGQYFVESTEELVDQLEALVGWWSGGGSDVGAGLADGEAESSPSYSRSGQS